MNRASLSVAGTVVALACRAKLRGVTLAALASLVALAALLLSSLAASAQTAPVVNSITASGFDTTSVTVVITFDRNVSFSPSTPTPFNWTLSYLAPGNQIRSYRNPGNSQDVTISGAAITVRFTGNLIESNVTDRMFAYTQSTNHIQDSGGNRVAEFEYSIPYTRPASPATAAAPNPDPSNLARGAVQWDPVGAMHGLPTQIGEIKSNKPSEPTGSVDLSNIAASVSEEREPHSRGYYLTTQVFGLGERSHLIRSGPDGARYIVDQDGQRYEVVSPGSLLLIKIWHVHNRPDRGTNSVELLGDTFLPRRDNRLTEPVEICLPVPQGDAERVRLAVKGRLDPHWTILDTTVKDGQVCAETVRVAWLTLAYAPEAAAA